MRTQLRRERIKRGWSQLYVASMTGLTYDTISRLENLKTCPSAYTTKKIEELFEMSMDELLKENQVPDQSKFTARIIKNIMVRKRVIIDDVVRTGYISIKIARKILSEQIYPTEFSIYAFAKALDMDYDEVEKCFYPDNRRMMV